MSQEAAQPSNTNESMGQKLASELVAAKEAYGSEHESIKEQPDFKAAIKTYVDKAGLNYDTEGERTENSYFTPDFEQVQKRIEINHALLQEVGPGAEGVSDMTICVPVALKQEDPEALAALVSKLQKSVKQGTYEVVFWVNVKASDVDKLDASQKYQEIIDKIRVVDHPNIQLRAALQILSPEEATISNIRANYMEAIAVDCEQKGRDLDYPVLWLDADTTFISPGSLEAITDSVKTHEAPFVHANLQYSADWAHGTPLSELDDATKAVVAAEIHRRQARRGTPEEGVPDTYIEESGLAFSIGDYLDTGGVNREDPVNESAHLLQKFHRNSSEKTYNKYQIGFKQLRAARIGTSARRHRELAKRYGVTALYDPDGEGYGLGGLYSEMETNEGGALISKDDMQYLLDMKEAENPIDSKYQQRNTRLLNKLFREHMEDEQEAA